MQPSKQALDLPTAAVAAQFSSVLGTGFAAVVLVWRDQLDPALPQLIIQGIAVIGAIADHPLRWGGGEALLEGGCDEPSLMRRSACNPHGDRKTMAVRNCHDLGPFAAACWTNSTAPFLLP